MKSIITDLELLFTADPESIKSESLLDNESVNHSVTNEPNVNPTIARRVKNRIRRRGYTTTFEGPVGAHPIGIAPMVGAWAAAAFGRGDNRKVAK